MSNSKKQQRLAISPDAQRQYELMARLTKREQMAIKAYFMEPTPENKRLAYLFALDKVSPIENKDLEKTKSLSNSWFRKESVIAYYNYLKTRYLLQDCKPMNANSLKDSGIALNSEVKVYNDDVSCSYTEQYQNPESLDDDLQGLTRSEQLKTYKSILNSTMDESIKLKCLDGINNIMGFKKDVPIEKDDRVFYFLPLRCDDCNAKKLWDDLKDGKSEGPEQPKHPDLL